MAERIFVAGHAGMVGAAICRRLASEDCRILSVARADLDLRRQTAVEEWFAETRPQAVIMAAGTVGGILANDTRPAEFLYDNLVIETNIIHAAHKVGVERLLFLGSACIYPREAPQPIAEDALLTGPLEPTNQWYAIAKIAGIKLCQAYRQQYGCDFISAQPNNLYGPGDNFDPASGHVIPALMAKVHDARVRGLKRMKVWGTGTARREFLYVEDMADAVVFLLKRFSGSVPINVGTGDEVTIRELAETIARVVGYEGKLIFDHSKPDGAPRKMLDSTRMANLGWTASTGLVDGLRKTYDWYVGT